MQDNSNTVEKANKPKLPTDFDNEEDFLTHIRVLASDDMGADKENREEEILDHKFVSGDQWDVEVYQQRMIERKPALTINRLPAFVAQLVGNQRSNEVDIKVIADNDSSKDEAMVREAIIRNIQKKSRAKRAYNATFQNQVIGGLGNFKVEVDYAHNEAFDLDINIVPIYNNHSVSWDRMSADPTGADARHVIVSERVTFADFKKRYPDFSTSSFREDYTDRAASEMEGWVDEKTVRVAEFWRVLSREKTIALLERQNVDGAPEKITVDVTELAEEEYIQNVVRDSQGRPIMRKTEVKYCEMYIVSGANVLEGPFELPIDRVPVFRAPGWEINIGDYKSRFGLIRFLRDPQRMHNYWRSIIVEKLMLAPKSKWLVGKTAGTGYEEQFRRAHTTNDPVLFWNDEAGSKPELIQPAAMETALIQEAGMAAQDIRDVSNQHEASLGMRSNEVSGRAIMARQRVGETGTVIYHDNLETAMEECGRVINQLIPYVYDTERVLEIMPDADNRQKQFIKINYGTQDSVDITSNIFNVTTVTGPSYETKRIEARESMMAAVNAMPDTFASVADLIAEAQDWPKSDIIAKRLKSTMPPNILGDDIAPERAAQLQQQAQTEEAVRSQMMQIDMAGKQAEIAFKQAQTEKARADAAEKMFSIGLDKARLQLDYMKAEEDIDNNKLDNFLKTMDTLLKGDENGA